MKIQFLILSPFLIWLSGCQPISKNQCLKPFPTIDYDYSYTDEPENGRLRLIFSSKSKRQICVGRQTWPNIHGDMMASGKSNGVYLFVNKQIFALKEKEQKYSSYCAEKSCYSPVDKGEKIEAYLYYKDFELTESSYSLTKELKYKPEPFWCDLGNFIN